MVGTHMPEEERVREREWGAADEWGRAGSERGESAAWAGARGEMGRERRGTSARERWPWDGVAPTEGRGFSFFFLFLFHYFSHFPFLLQLYTHI
jgi:hypothetical protein